MKRFPSITIQRAPAHQNERLARWLREWEIHQALPEALAAPKPESSRIAGSTRYQSADDAAEARAAVGQVRLLAPTNPITSSRLWYVALLPSATPDECLLAPFSQFTEPAVPGEWLTGLTVPALRVLSLWNARESAMAELPDSWLVEDLSASQAAAAHAVWRHHRGMAPLPPALATDIGPPLPHPLDPRREYLEISRIEFDQVVAAPRSQRRGARVIPFPRSAAEQLALAAEGTAEYGETLVWTIEGSPCRLLTAPASSPMGEARVLHIVDQAGQRSTTFDGAQLATTDQRHSATIQQGLVTIPVDWLAHLTAVRESNGSSRRLLVG